MKDRIRNHEINTMYCPTAIMVAYYFAKPLQGTLFKTIRSIIMRRTHRIPPFKDPSLSDEEHVEICGFLGTSDKKYQTIVTGILINDRPSYIQIAQLNTMTNDVV